ncbi:MAG: hypothetical protein A2538_01385 [Candidatus Magasanikbacteria bacterium RIFOXYD2_FULL_41_14]|uniref:Uncharacterized protein n=1 Tax=Candidatus Magasanikbacteria bacterium RIFOXYD2_FULL_41_14 TaxID=1798709 RepID=A0A1F6PGE7_9BACT|nr:MAG: hypothetical protein A2538_01385 [Candidatus Magasanikbacteria bacterium RIFOXYD2_FULL_41_14]
MRPRTWGSTGERDTPDLSDQTAEGSHEEGVNDGHRRVDERHDADGHDDAEDPLHLFSFLAHEAPTTSAVHERAETS